MRADRLDTSEDLCTQSFCRVFMLVTIILFHLVFGRAILNTGRRREAPQCGWRAAEIDVTCAFNEPLDHRRSRCRPSRPRPTGPAYKTSIEQKPRAIECWYCIQGIPRSFRNADCRCLRVGDTQRVKGSRGSTTHLGDNCNLIMPCRDADARCRDAMIIWLKAGFRGACRPAIRFHPAKGSSRFPLSFEVPTKAPRCHSRDERCLVEHIWI